MERLDQVVLQKIVHVAMDVMLQSKAQRKKERRLEQVIHRDDAENPCVPAV